MVDDIIVRFRPDEGMAPEVVTQVSSDVSGEMVAALVVCASGETVAIEVRSIKPQGFGPDSSHDISTEPLPKCRAIHRVEIIEDGPVRGDKKTGRSAGAVKSPAGAPRDFAAEADMMLQKEDSTEAWVKPSAQQWESDTV